MQLHSNFSPPHPFWKVPPVFLPLIGRSREIDEIKARLAAPDKRLLTLLGTGGIGKTRLSVQLAHELKPLFADGVCFVTLTAISDPVQVLSLIARELDLQDESIPAQERVQRFLREKQMLLILDNFEHVVQAAPALEQLLVACPRLKILVTSRVVLRSAIEYEYRLSSLAMPDLQHLPDSASIARFASIELFVQRARALLPTFHVTEANAAALAEICVRLDGVPLAIELAAARNKLLPPQSLLPRLSKSLQLLTKGSPTLPARQQTLLNTIQWSYDLLDIDEQRLFRLLSVFVGGFTISAAESLFAAIMEGTTSSMATALDGLASLLDKSLLQPSEPTGDLGEQEDQRLEMLETIREFARERLQEHGEIAPARQGHAEYYLKLAEEAAQKLQGQEQVKWLERLDQDHGNLQSAMDWLLAASTPNPGPESSYRVEAGLDPALFSPGAATFPQLTQALRLGNALSSFWVSRGYPTEGWRFMEQALRLCEGEVTPVQAHAYIVASQLSMRLGNLDRAEILVEQGIQSFQALGDRANLATSLRAAGWIAHQKSQIAHAYHLYEQALALYKQLHDKKGIASTMLNMAFIRQTQGDYEQARALLEEVVIQHRALNNKAGLIGALYQLAQVLFGAEERYPVQRIRSLLDEGLELAQELGDRRGEASMQGLLGWIVGSQGHLAQARSLIEDCLRFYKQGGDREITGHYLAILAGIVTAQGDYAAARSLLEESLAVGKEIGSKTEIIAVALEGMAELALAQADRPWAVRLWGAAAQWREASQFSMLPSQRLAYEHRVQEVRQFLGKKAFTTLWDDGRTLTLDEVWPSRYRPLPYQHEIVVTPPQSRQKSSEYPAGLSAREVEVLCLVAQGLSDAQIAEQLIIGTRTINTHLTSIYHKLGVNSRSAAVRFAAEHQLL